MAKKRNEDKKETAAEKTQEDAVQEEVKEECVDAADEGPTEGADVAAVEQDETDRTRPILPLFTLPGVVILPRVAEKRLRREFDLKPQDVYFTINDSNVVEVYEK